MSTAGETTINSTSSGSPVTVYDRATDQPGNSVAVYNPSDAETVFVSVQPLHPVGEFFPLTPKMAIELGPVPTPGIQRVRAYASLANIKLNHTITSRQ